MIGGRSDADDLFIEPTVVTDVDMSDSTMQAELFGPIMPIVTVKNKAGSCKVHQDCPSLTLYVNFTNVISVLIPW